MSRLRPRRSTLGVGALVIAGLSLTQALQNLVPDPQDGAFGTGLQRPFAHAVSVGDSAELRAGTLHVTSIEGAQTISAPYEYPVKTDGVFLVARFEWTPRDQASQIAKAVVTDERARTFIAQGTGTMRNKVACPMTTPGLTMECVVVVELPRDALAGSRLVLSGDALDDGYDDVAQLDLGLSADEAQSFGRGASAEAAAHYKGLS